MKCICFSLSIKKYVEVFVFFAPRCERLNVPIDSKTTSILLSKEIEPRVANILVTSTKRKKTKASIK